MSLFEKLDPETLTPAKLWSEMDAEARRLAITTIYGSDFEDPSARAEVDGAIATALRFRPTAVRKLPLTKRVDYALKALRPNDALASTLLLALHLGKRREILEAFLDELGIEHEQGVIQDEDLGPPQAEKVGPAVERLYERFPVDQVELYLAALVAMEPDVWEGLVPHLRARST